MLKLGVYTRQQFFTAPPNGGWSWLRYRLSRSRVSLDLLPHGEDQASNEDADWFEGLMPHVRLSSGVYRTTFRGRFYNLDSIVNRILADHFSSGDPLVVEDWAASACLTSLEWVESLFPAFPYLKFSASDLELFLISVKSPTGETFVFERNGQLLQYVTPPFVIRMEPPEPWLLPVNRLLYLRGRRHSRRTAGLWPLPQNWLDDFCNLDPIQRDGFVVRKLLLIHPQAISAARQDPRFSIRRHSVFEKSPDPCHVIRSMNILNRAYFSEERLNEGIQSIVASLITGGIWIVGRTIRDNPPVHEVTVFRKESSSTLQVVERMGPGSEIESLALSAFNNSRR